MKRASKLRVLRQPDPGQAPHPRYVVWELTLACDQRCTHCGSRAAEARPDELTTSEALDVVGQLAALGTRELTLIGGEAYLHPGFFEVIAAARASGIRVTMTTGGRGVTADLARQCVASGMHGATVSIDGLAATHDLVRATRGSFDSALAALAHFRAAGLIVTCNTVVNRLNLDELEPLYETLKGTGMRGWQVQLIVALGRAADRPELLVQPWQLLTLVPRIARLKERAFADGILISPGNNIGYFSRDEKLLRSLTPDGQDHWAGCTAGRYGLGIESDGAVKGCPSLPTSHYVGGRVREQSLRQIWDHAPELAFTRRRTVEDLWGFCRSCPFADVCYAGCNFTAHALFGRAGNNPYCHYRAKTLADRGVRERLVLREAAPGEPFDHGRFEIVEEPFDAPDPAPPRREHRLRVWRSASIALLLMMLGARASAQPPAEPALKIDAVRLTRLPPRTEWPGDDVEITVTVENSSDARLFVPSMIKKWAYDATTKTLTVDFREPTPQPPPKPHGSIGYATVQRTFPLHADMVEIPAHARVDLKELRGVVWTQPRLLDSGSFERETIDMSAVERVAVSVPTDATKFVRGQSEDVELARTRFESWGTNVAKTFDAKLPATRR